ncbi:MAG: hypothetical protein NDJ89_18595 [Oligoflexia bacterium]|nr:hypothetical protein [Oligoflexia bacterium]
MSGQSIAPRDAKIGEFILELGDFARLAEEALTNLEKDPESNKGLFSEFSEKMIAIRGTAQQLELPSIARIAGYGEEIAIKGSSPLSPSQTRRAVSCLWDALTTVKYMLSHPSQETSEEQQFLINRLEKTLQSLGGARPTVSGDEIDALLAAQRKH